ncbi:hypothetical protein GCM10010515_50920 [Streptomyces fructofermentans]|uniref:Uncharacterized protein n=1 Tax=Streptomyces fructofermentans TaxID=152141 RepID=A0A918KUB1_9ACTN|nr:hypothetical protein GCM10010515_50920 [Streptomyces fructofermentans]
MEVTPNLAADGVACQGVDRTRIAVSIKLGINVDRVSAARHSLRRDVDGPLSQRGPRHAPCFPTIGRGK